MVARFRPLSETEIKRGDADKKPFNINNRAVVDQESYSLRQYVLDHIIPEATQQDEARAYWQQPTLIPFQVYEFAASATVEEVLKGYNVNASIWSAPE